jgi:predicted GTPase
MTVFEKEFLQNVLIVGNIGNGKSSVTNKLAGRGKDVAKAA